MYVLDTNVVSELHRPRPHPNVIDWVNHQMDDMLHLAAVTIGELQAGAERLRLREAERATALDTWIDDVMSSYRVIPVDGAIYRVWARLMNGQPDSLYEDALIAATAATRDFAVVTRNVRDFRRLGATVVDPFAPASR